MFAWFICHYLDYSMQFSKFRGQLRAGFDNGRVVLLPFHRNGGFDSGPQYLAEKEQIGQQSTDMA